MGSYTYPQPSDISWHKSGALDNEGLSEEWLAHEKALGFRPQVNLEGTPDEQRAVLNGMSAMRDANIKDIDSLKSEVEATDEEITATAGHKIPIRVYRPTGKTTRHNGPDESSDMRPPVPAAVFYHGGGWVLGNIQADDFMARMISRDLGHVVVSVEYRLAPEHTHIEQADDCFDAFVWTVQNAEKLNIDDKNIYTTGNSAGGHLAAVVSQRIVESEYASNLAAQILRIPFTCDPASYPGELPARPTVPIFSDSALKGMLDVYVPNAADRKTPGVSPLLAKSDVLKRLPPTYIDACAADPLCVPALSYGKELEENGVPVKAFVLEGMPHGSYVLFPDLPSSRTAWDACVAGTKWALSIKKQA